MKSNYYLAHDANLRRFDALFTELDILETSWAIEKIPSLVAFITKDKTVMAGNKVFLAEQDIPVNTKIEQVSNTYQQQGCSVIYLAIENRVVGVIALSDTLKKEAVTIIDEMYRSSVTPVLLSGDHQNATQTIANQLHIRPVHANCSPEEKVRWIDTYQKEQQVCIIGDGINDAPALKKAVVGIAMGGMGSDIAVDAADIALVNDDIKKLPHLIALSKKMLRTIH